MFKEGFEKVAAGWNNPTTAANMAAVQAGATASGMGQAKTQMGNLTSPADLVRKSGGLTGWANIKNELGFGRSS